MQLARFQNLAVSQIFFLGGGQIFILAGYKIKYIMSIGYTRTFKVIVFMLT